MSERQEFNHSKDNALAIASKDCPEIFGELYETYLVYLIKYICSRTRKLDLAEEMAHDILSHAFENRRKYNPIGNFVNWLTTIAKNKLIDQHRANSKSPSSIPLDESLDAISPNSDPVIQIIQHEQDSSLHRAVNLLPIPSQVVLYLKFVSRASNKRIAEVVGTTEGGVKDRQHKALDFLGKQLALHNEQNELKAG